MPASESTSARPSAKLPPAERLRRLEAARAPVCKGARLPTSARVAHRFRKAMAAHRGEMTLAAGAPPVLAEGIFLASVALMEQGQRATMAGHTVGPALNHLLWLIRTEPLFTLPPAIAPGQWASVGK